MSAEPEAAPASPAKPPFANMDEYLAEIEAHASPAKETPMGEGHVCQHGIRWPHECKPCADAAWQAKEATREGETTETDAWQSKFNRHLTFDEEMPANHPALRQMRKLERERNAAERRAAAAESAMGEHHDCGFCGGRMSRNPHPNAGIPEHLCKVGAMWECVPCAQKNIHRKWERICGLRRDLTAAESERDALRKALERIRDKAHQGTGVASGIAQAALTQKALAPTNKTTNKKE